MDKLGPEWQQLLTGMRQALLLALDVLERTLGMMPTTAQIRRWWRSAGRPGPEE